MKLNWMILLLVLSSTYVLAQDGYGYDYGGNYGDILSMRNLIISGIALLVLIIICILWYRGFKKKRNDYYY